MPLVDDGPLHVPEQLPFAPRPVPTELLSSWLLRVASANFISLRELLDGFSSRYGRVLSNVPIDYEIPESAVQALSQFCRVAPKGIRMLDLNQHLPNVKPSALLMFRTGDVPFDQSPTHRVGYGFCPSCVSHQQIVHIPREWSLACLARCAIHRTPLLDECSLCGRSDPVSLQDVGSAKGALCKWCDGDLVGHGQDDFPDLNRVMLQSVEDDYRAALQGAAPVLLPNTTAEEFRFFFEEMLHLLACVLNSRFSRKGLFTRQDMATIVGALILNASMIGNRTPHRGRTVGLRLWGTLLSVIPQDEGDKIERTSIRWPSALRRRFLSGLAARKRNRWPYTPYRPSAHRSTVQRDEIAPVYGLRA